MCIVIYSREKVTQLIKKKIGTGEKEMSMINKVQNMLGKKKRYTHTPAECEYFILCEYQYGTQQCSMKRGACVQCERRNGYINENVGTDIEGKRYEIITEEGRKDLWGMK